MKLAEKALEIDDDPRPKDRATWQRLRLLVEEEACHRDWGCALYRLHRTGRIDNDQREAGDIYARLVSDHRKLWRDRMGAVEPYRTTDRGYDTRRSPQVRDLIRDVEHAMAHVIADDLAAESEFEIARARRVSRRYKEARAIAGGINSALEEMLVDEIWPTSERCHKEIGHALTRLSHFFHTGTKRERKNVV